MFGPGQPTARNGIIGDYKFCAAAVFVPDGGNFSGDICDQVCTKTAKALVALKTETRGNHAGLYFLKEAHCTDAGYIYTNHLG